MPTPSGPSFIPKQNPVKVARRGNARQIYVFTIISYMLIIAALVAVAGVFIFDRYTKSVLAKEVENLKKAMSSFSVEDMNEVVELDRQLATVGTLLDKGVSIPAVLTILENATIDTVQFTDMSLTREDNGDIAVEATIITDSFDSVLFQRDIYEAAEKVAAIKVSDVEMTFATGGSESGSRNTPARVNFSATFSIDESAAATAPGVPGVANQPSVVPVGQPATPPPATPLEAGTQPPQP